VVSESEHMSRRYAVLDIYEDFFSRCKMYFGHTGSRRIPRTRRYKTCEEEYLRAGGKKAWTSSRLISGTLYFETFELRALMSSNGKDGTPMQEYRRTGAKEIFYRYRV
jgi:hypothetical protein